MAAPLAAVALTRAAPPPPPPDIGLAPSMTPPLSLSSSSGMVAVAAVLVWQPLSHSREQSTAEPPLVQCIAAAERCRQCP